MKIKILFLFCCVLFCLGCSSGEQTEKGDVGTKSDSGQNIVDSGIEDSGAGDTSTGADPDDCQQYDGNKTACAEAGCNLYYEGSTWCVKEGKCLIDTESAGFCDHVPDATISGLGAALYRLDLGVAIEAGKNTAGLTDWKTCPEDETGTPVCLCLQQSNTDAAEGECL